MLYCLIQSSFHHILYISILLNGMSSICVILPATVLSSIMVQLDCHSSIMVQLDCHSSNYSAGIPGLQLLCFRICPSIYA